MLVNSADPDRTDQDLHCSHRLPRDNQGDASVALVVSGYTVCCLPFPLHISDALLYCQTKARGYKTFFMLNSWNF